MADKVIDPGNEPSKAKPHSLPWLINLIRTRGGVDLKATESALLVAEVDRLTRERWTIARDGYLAAIEHTAGDCPPSLLPDTVRRKWDAESEAYANTLYPFPVDLTPND